MTTEISLSDAQRQVDEWIGSTGAGYFGILTNLGILTEEVGEVARILVRTHGGQSPKAEDQCLDLGDELADVLWVLFALANQNGIDLNAAFTRNLEKKRLRDAGRHG